MILSNENNYIFLHSRKTAGSSVTAALAAHLAPDDVMVGSWMDAHALGIPLNRHARQIAWKYPLPCAVSSARTLLSQGRFEPAPEFAHNRIKSYYRTHHGFSAAAHSPATEVRALDPDLWDRAFKFVFVRNPWTHAVSDYSWRCKVTNTQIPFAEFLRRLDDPARPDPEGVRPPVISNWPIYTIDDQVAVDFVGRYENIEADLATIGREIGLDVSISSIRAKGDVRSKRKPVKDYYTDADSVDIVRRVYAPEISEFAYDIPF